MKPKDILSKELPPPPCVPRSIRYGRSGFAHHSFVGSLLFAVTLLRREILPFIFHDVVLPPKNEVLESFKALHGDGFCVHRGPRSDPPLSRVFTQKLTGELRALPQIFHRACGRARGRPICDGINQLSTSGKSSSARPWPEAIFWREETSDWPERRHTL